MKNGKTQIGPKKAGAMQRVIDLSWDNEKTRVEPHEAGSPEEAETMQRVLDHLWDDEWRQHGAALEELVFQELQTAARHLAEGDEERPFKGGHLVFTPGIEKRVSPVEMHRALWRHLSGDWGEVCEDDRAANEQALKVGARLFSVYRNRYGVPFWVITEADRSSTCVLLPEEY